MKPGSSQTQGGVGLLIAAAVLLGLWQLAAVVVNNQMLPPPLAALTSFIQLAQGPLAIHLWSSFYRAGYSILLSLVLAVPLGLFLGRNPRVDHWVAPMIFLTYPIPKIVFLPLVLLFLGIGDASKIFLITLIVFYQILVTTRDAAKGVPEADILSLRSLGGGPWAVYRHVIVPACLPDILTALRISSGTAVAVLFLVESFATVEGLGYFIMDAWTRASAAEMFAGIIAMGVLGFVLILGVDLMERYLCRWRQT
ncbi:MAG: ABC transporter permease [Heliobacteriaceae bacterium]|nr:ABC transporter permease [Heliobacteriaceae bacterium]MDD4587486.1 ABC transporter permease [Heliobacteriaceae bacterium]